MVDEARVVRLLRGIEADAARLAAAQVAAASADPTETELAAIKYRFVTAIEGCTRVAQHLCASEGWGAPMSNADAIAELGRRGVLESATAQRVARSVGLRNVLVHQYADVDDRRVVEHLSRVDDLRDFCAQVARWLGG